MIFKHLPIIISLVLGANISSIAYAEDSVILLHGILKTSSSMAKLENKFIAKNYQVLNLTYPSTSKSLEEIIEFIHKPITEFNKNQSNEIHFVTHSMGGLVARGYLNKYRPNNLGKVIMLSTPNQGSKMADFLQKHINNLFLYIYGPASQQLTTDQSNIANFLGTVNYPLGIITGDRSIDPITSFIIDGPDDGKVSIENTKLKEAKEHKVIHATHTFIMDNKKAIKNIFSFIEKGSFISEISL